MKVRTEARRQAILEAAAQLFQETGYERASMNELTKRLGGSKATLYGYFPSKEALFAAVVRTVATSHLSDAVSRLSEDSDVETPLDALLTRFGERMLKVLMADRGALAVYRMVVAESGQSNVGQLFHDSGPGEALKALAGIFAAAMERGELRRADPHLRAAQFTSLVMAETSQRLYQVDPPPLTLKQIRVMARRGVDMFFNGALA